MKKLIIVVIVLAAVGAAIYGGVNYISGKNSGTVGTPVTETIVGRDTIITKVTSKGEVSLLNTELVYANIVAEVEEVLVEKNDAVIEGQPIIRYKEKSKEDLKRNIEKARLDVKSAEIALESAMILPSKSVIELERARFDVENAEKAVERAKNELDDFDWELTKHEEKIEDAWKDLELNEKLLSAGAISRQGVDDAEKAIKELEDGLESMKKSREYKLRQIIDAEDNYRYSLLMYEDTVDKSADISTDMSAQNTIKQQEIALQKARLALSQYEKELADFKLEIYSPISGTVTNVNISQGEITPTDKALMEIADLSDYIVKVDVNERNASKIAIGQDVNLSGAVLGEGTLKGKLTKIGYIAETKQNNSGTERVVPVEITVEKSEEANILKPGFSLDSSIITSVKENIVVIPILSTLSESDGSNFVFVIKDDDTLEKRLVNLGAYADMFVEAEGVEEGEKIVTQPTVDMTDGMVITVMNREPAEAQSEGESE